MDFGSELSGSSNLVTLQHYYRRSPNPSNQPCKSWNLSKILNSIMNPQSKFILGFVPMLISIHSWPICLSTPALDRRLHLVPLVLWLCSFQLWCIVETIPCYLLQRIDRHCQTVPPVNAWSTGNAVALSLPSSLQIGHTSFIPDTTSIDVCLQSLS